VEPRLTVAPAESQRPKTSRDPGDAMSQWQRISGRRAPRHQLGRTIPL